MDRIIKTIGDIMTNKVIIVIPARYASTRFPAKPLAELTGATGEKKTLLQRSWEAALKVTGVDKVVVATDDDRIRIAAEEFGADVVMTPENCHNGTARCSAVAKKLPDYDIYVNLQGDAPLTPAHFVEDLIATLEHQEVGVATPVLRCDASALESFKADRENGRVGGTTVVFNRHGDALYFSKEVIPYTGRDILMDSEVPVFHHVGVYGYRRAMLSAYDAMEFGTLEAWEGLEQLRFLNHGQNIRCVEVEAQGHKFWELNNPTDIPIIESALWEQGIP